MFCTGFYIRRQVWCCKYSRWNAYDIAFQLSLFCLQGNAQLNEILNTLKTSVLINFCL